MAKAAPGISYQEGMTDQENSFRDVNAPPEQWEWNVVADEAATLVIFDKPGEDVLIGQYKGVETITPENGEDEPFDRYLFRGTDGELYAVNKSYKLERAMSGVNVNDWTRLEYVKDIPVKKGNPLKDFRVSVRK